MTLTGAGLLWFGWFGFNAGSALASGQLAALAFMTTHLGAAGGALGWLVGRVAASRQTDGARRRIGSRRGARRDHAGGGVRRAWAAIVIGVVAGGVCYAGVLLKPFGYDDSLDAFGVHGVGGLAGALLTGVFAQKALNDAGADGALFGNVQQLGVQALACAATGAYAVVVTFGILKLIDATIGLRVTENEEREGLDTTQHGEEAYGESSGGMSHERVEEQAAAVLVPSEGGAE